MERIAHREQDFIYLAQRPSNTSILIEDTNLRALKPLLHKTFSFTRDVTSKMGSDFVRLYQEKRAEKGIENTLGSLNFLIRHKLHLPSFYAFDSINAAEFLHTTGFDSTEVDEDKLLLIFRFPELVSRWNKFKYEECIPRKLTTEWGKMARPLKKNVWKTVTQYSPQLTFGRINCEGEHESDMYHYIWEVGLHDGKYEDGSCNFQF